jgi:hypothetical protein
MAISYSKVLVRVKHSLPHGRPTDFPLPPKRQEKSTVSTLFVPAMICNGFLVEPSRAGQVKSWCITLNLPRERKAPQTEVKWNKNTQHGSYSTFTNSFRAMSVPGGSNQVLQAVLYRCEIDHRSTNPNPTMWSIVSRERDGETGSGGHPSAQFALSSDVRNIIFRECGVAFKALSIARGCSVRWPRMVEIISD